MTSEVTCNLTVSSLAEESVDRDFTDNFVVMAFERDAGKTAVLCCKQDNGVQFM